MIIFESEYATAIPLNHPRICSGNYPATVSADVVGETYNSDAVLGANTYERYDPATAATITLDFGVNVDVSYLAIAAHSLSNPNDSTVERIVIQYSDDNISFTTLYDGSPVSNGPDDKSPLIFVFNEVSMRYMTFYTEKAGFEVGVMYAGKILEIYRGIYSGHTPVTFNRNTVKNLNRSIKGQFLGTSIVRSGLSASYSFSNVPITWYEDNIEPLSLFARTKPFFIAWNPLEHPTQTAYGYAKGDIKPTLNGVKNYCDFDFGIDAYA